jgi:hypothetical protein
MYPDPIIEPKTKATIITNHSGKRSCALYAKKAAKTTMTIKIKGRMNLSS